MENNNRTLFLIDAYALIYRSYYAFIKNPRINSKGENTSAVFGFVNTLEELLRHEHPTHLAVAFDPHGKTFRHEAYELYKAQREETPEVIRWSVPIIKDILKAYCIPILEVPGFEADDVVGTMAAMAERKGFTVYMMTPDKDYGQLVTEHTFIYKPMNGVGGFEVLGPKQVCEKYGISSPLQVIDLLSLMGDASDNIPGCPGIGKVYAQKLLSQFGSVENLLAHTDELKGAIREKVESNRDKIEFSKFLATIRRDVPLDFNEEELKTVECDRRKVLNIFERLEFYNWSNRIKKDMGNLSEPEPVNKQTPEVKRKKDDIQLDLFSSLNAEDEINACGCTENEKHNSPETLKIDFKHVLNIDSEELTQKVGAEIKQQKKCCIYIEYLNNDNSSFEFKNIYLLTSSCKYCLRFSHKENGNIRFFDFLKKIFEDAEILKIGHDVKRIILGLKNYSIGMEGPIFDTMVAHYLLQPEQNHSLPLLAKIYTGYEGSEENYVECIQLMTEKLEKLISEENLDKLLYDVELPLVFVLADMEWTGVEIDTEALKTYSKELTLKMNEIEKEIYHLAGEKFNINSSRQVGELLFNKLQIGNNENGRKLKKTKVSKQISTSEDVLQSLKDQYPIVSKILDYRGIKKLLSTYIDAFPNWISRKTGKIHTSFNQTVTSTGRLSSSNPNLQNIPIRDEMGKEMRKVFTAGKDNVFFSADYSQIELRIMAEMSGDEHMKEAFRHGEDVHRATAARLFNVPLNEVTPDMRRKAKTANFGIIYGISTFGLAERMEVTRTEAKKIIEDYFRTYHRIKEYMDECIHTAQEKQYVETYWHRKRYLPDIVSHNAIVRGYAERNAINAPIQGTAADIIKIAMVRIYNALKKNHLKTKMILQVHDELNFIVPADEVEQVEAIVRENMENFGQFSVPLKAEIGRGINWLEAHG